MEPGTSQVNAPHRLEDDRSLIVYKDVNNDGQKMLLGTVEIGPDTTLSDILEDIRDCLGQTEEFTIKKCSIPLHTPEQNHYRAVSLFRKQEEFIVVVPFRVWQPLDLVAIFNNVNVPSDLLLLDETDTATGTAPASSISPPIGAPLQLQHSESDRVQSSRLAADVPGLSLMPSDVFTSNLLPSQLLPATPTQTTAPGYQRRHSAATNQSLVYPFPLSLPPD